MIRKKDVAFRARDWNGREVVLLKSTIRDHIARFHFDELLVIERLKEQFAQPKIVVENRNVGSEQAIYNIGAGGHAYLQVNVKHRGLLKSRIIVTLYGVDSIPKGRVLWPKQR